MPNAFRPVALRRIASLISATNAEFGSELLTLAMPDNKPPKTRAETSGGVTFRRD